MTSATRRPASFVVGFAALCVCLASCSAKSSNAQASGGTTKAGASAPAAASDPAQASAPADSAAPAHGTVDPCSLLTDSEASTALGGPAAHVVVAARDAGNGSGLKVTENRCNYNLITSDQSGNNIYVDVFNGANREYFDETADNSDHSALPGLGDSATAAQNEVYVFSKGTMLLIYGSLDGDGIQNVAKLAIAKL
jgi:hypothetical protein